MYSRVRKKGEETPSLLSYTEQVKEETGGNSYSNFVYRAGYEREGRELTVNLSAAV